MIEVKNIKKSFGDKTILEDISGVMDTGKCNLIIGSSGSGKTVFTKCIVGLFKPDRGDILYDGKNMLEMDREDVLAGRFRAQSRFLVPPARSLSRSRSGRTA